MKPLVSGEKQLFFFPLHLWYKTNTEVDYSSEGDLRIWKKYMYYFFLL